ncbi:unnamed protein product [Phyllotreta striolata]|uniref:Fatty acyl-CoA reductase n=1 Tax=Phyllotreta striolata TaxID=444603 RepID=A0A9N9XQK8_PHYSR|nr:unnamed protein product [Phyllotreta striolata]
MFGKAKENVSIPKFFENKSVLITGGTGFIGRLLLEKLLRSCQKIDKIYVVIRPKKGKSVQERIQENINIPIFDKLREEQPEQLNKIIPLAGDTEKLGLGLSEEDRKTVIENVSIVFHNAASVRFDDHLKKAVISNTRAAREIVLLARQLKKIDVLVDTSTAYCNSDNLIVQEKLYPAKIHWSDLVKIAEEGDERLLEVVAHKIIQPLPNTYTFSKAAAEHAVVELSKGKIPAVIVRPTIIQPTYSDPIPGWVDNINGSVGMMYGMGRGILRSVYGDTNAVFDHVFADSVIKSLIISAWRTALAKDLNNVPIYNIASDLNYKSSDLFVLGNEYSRKFPLKYYIWPAKPRLYENYYVFLFFALLNHILPALIVDSVLWITGRKPMLYTIQRKVFLANTCLIHFMTNSWNFVHNNYLDLMDSILPDDKKDFTVDHFGKTPHQSKKNHYIFNIYFQGIRKYVAKDADADEHDVRKRNRLIFVERIWKLMWLIIFLRYLIPKLILLFDNIMIYIENL